MESYCTTQRCVKVLLEMPSDNKQSRVLNQSTEESNYTCICRIPSLCVGKVPVLPNAVCAEQVILVLVSTDRQSLCLVEDCVNGQSTSALN